MLASKKKGKAAAAAATAAAAAATAPAHNLVGVRAMSVLLPVCVREVQCSQRGHLQVANDAQAVQANDEAEVLRIHLVVRGCGVVGVPSNQRHQ